VTFQLEAVQSAVHPGEHTHLAATDPWTRRCRSCISSSIWI